MSEPCRHIRLILQEGPMEKGARYVCEGCGASFRVIGAPIGGHLGTKKEKEK
jgi:hypothetical protein